MQSTCIEVFTKHKYCNTLPYWYFVASRRSLRICGDAVRISVKQKIIGAMYGSLLLRVYSEEVSVVSKPIFALLKVMFLIVLVWQVSEHETFGQIEKDEGDKVVLSQW